jgi:phenylalanyl-tRNA synthetase beta chain
MASIKFSKKNFEKDMGKLTEEMLQKIALFGMTVESVSNDEVELDVTPDRPDLLSYQNFKRSFLAFTGKKTGLKEYKINKPEKDFKVKIDSSVKGVRPYTVCAIVKNLKLSDEKIKEIIDIQEKLHVTVGRKRKKLAIGIYPLEKIKLPIIFKALEPDKIKFIPLEMEREMSGLQILQRHPTGRDYAHLLAGKSKFPVFVDANENVLSMPPIINSHMTGKVELTTKDVFIECSGFDLEVLKKCLNILVSSFAEMGGEIYQMEVSGLPKENVTPDLTPEKMKISPENVNRILGLKIDKKELKNLLERMGHNYKNDLVEIGAWRTDILHEVDLIEDVAIAYGYDKLEPEIPEIATIGQENLHETIKRKISEILSGLGMLEISNYHLTTKEDQFSKMGVPEKMEKGFVQLEESKTENNILRKDMSHYLLKIFSENVDSEYPQKIYETGRVFEIENNKISEKENLSIGISPGNFTDVKQTLNYLLRMLGINSEEISIKETENFPGYFIDGRVGEIILKGKKIGFLGEIHPKILRNWKIKMPVALAEISLEEIFDLVK